MTTAEHQLLTRARDILKRYLNTVESREWLNDYHWFQAEKRIQLLTERTSENEDSITGSVTQRGD